MIAFPTFPTSVFEVGNENELKGNGYSHLSHLSHHFRHIAP
jgi:hypothetical protein